MYVSSFKCQWFFSSGASQQQDTLGSGNDSEIWEVPRQQRCRYACQIWKRYDNQNTRSRGFRDFTESYSKTSVRLVTIGPREFPFVEITPSRDRLIFIIGIPIKVKSSKGAHFSKYVNFIIKWVNFVWYLYYSALDNWNLAWRNKILTLRLLWNFHGKISALMISHIRYSFFTFGIKTMGVLHSGRSEKYHDTLFCCSCGALTHWSLESF